MHEFRRGLELFNSGRFYDAHEVLEDAWRAAPEPDKKFLQGLIQIAVGLHHYSTGNMAGAKSLLARGARNLHGYGESYGGINLAALQHAVVEWQNALEHGTAVPPWPRAEPDSGC